MQMKRKIVVLGSYGEFTRRVTIDVAAMPQVECVLGLPPSAQATTFASAVGVPFMVIDPNESSSLQRLLEGAFAVVNLHGPFATREHVAVAARCAALGVHYVDPADAREYMTEFARLARDARDHEALLVTGAGAVPAVAAALVRMLVKEFDRVSEIHIFLAPGMGDQRELATVQSILDQGDNPVRTKERGRRPKQHWRTKPEPVRFPEPVGVRRGWLCDLERDALAREFGVGTVTTRTGFAPGFLSFMITILEKLRQRGTVRELSPLIAWFVRRAAARRGRHSLGRASSIRVAVRGSRRNHDEEYVAYLVARDGAGPAIAAAPILALVRRWVEKGVKETGAVTCVDMLGFDDLRPELMNHNIVLVRE